jgi:hypothetical protein
MRESALVIYLAAPSSYTTTASSHFSPRAPKLTLTETPFPLQCPGHIPYIVAYTLHGLK